MRYINRKIFNKYYNLTVITGVFMLWNPAIAATLNLSDRPLFLGTTVEPNIFLVIDDSGSMDWEVLKSKGALAAHGTDDNRGNLDFNPGNPTDRRELCVGYNRLAYNPAVNYTPWSGLDSAGKPYRNQSLAAARDNPFVTTGTLNLTSHYYFAWTDNGDNVYQNGECQIGNSDRIAVNTLPSSQQTNYANWYSYYRKREYVAKAAYGSVIVDAQSSRIGMMTLNRNNDVNMPVRSMNADFTSGNKRQLMDKLYNINSRGGTPLQNAMYRAGEYLFGRNTNWLEAGSTENFSDPRLPVDDGGICQQNFSIVMTDGYYNGNFDFSVGNTDTDGAGPWDGGDYADSSSDTLADIAMKYYEEDLNTSAPPGVPTSSVDMNADQHVVTYTVAFGVNGTLSCGPDDSVDNFGNTCPAPFPGWPNPNSNARRIDDLRHAAYNGRGLFLSAGSSQSLVQSINDAIGNIISRTSSSAGVAFNSTSIQTGSILFQGRYRTTDWSGDLRYLPVNNNGGVGTVVISTAAVLDSTLPNDRSIITVNSTTGLGVPFRWDSIDASQQTALGNEDALDYLRGERGCETGSAAACLSGNKNLRNRSTALGDIIHSGAAYVAAPDKFYDFDDYAAFFNSNESRQPMVYVGANDGMLHGFDADATSGTAGEELIAFVPGTLYDKLSDISDTSYIHQYYVDGSPIIGDAHYAGAWHTVLVNGLRGGGQGIFALDVTDPSAFTEANASDLLLWEFTDSDDADLGYTFSEPAIVKMANGRFAAVFGNGYNSTIDDGAIGTGEAVLYVVDLESGSLLAKISTTGVGSPADPNGLATPTVVDVDGDFITDYAYAGDLHGNIWRFDFTSSNPLQWKISFTSSPLFTAQSPEGDRQQITSQPVLSVRPGNDGYMLYFGTGKYLESADNATNNQPTQTFYAIWDKWSKDSTTTYSSFTRSDLLQQTIIEERTINGTEARITSDNPIDWLVHQGWYMDLVNTSTNKNLGEKQVTSAVLRNGRIFFTTLIPSTAACESGGTGWLMVLDATNGSRLNNSPFDVNGDGKFDQDDNVPPPGGGATDNIAVSGARSNSGIISGPSLIESKSGGSDFIAVSNSSGLVGLGSLFNSGDNTPSGGGGVPPTGGPNGSDDNSNGAFAEVDRGIPFGRILWQQLK